MDHWVSAGQPSQYSDATARIVLARAARGDTLDMILAAPNMPCRRTLYDWIHVVPRFGRAWQDMRVAEVEMAAELAEIPTLTAA